MTTIKNIKGTTGLTSFPAGELAYSPGALGGTTGLTSSAVGITLNVITVTADPTNEPPRVIISVTQAGASVQVTRTVAASVYPGDQFFPGTDVFLDVAQLEDPNRDTGGGWNLVDGQWTGYDYEMPFGEDVIYTVTSYDNVNQTGTPLATQISQAVNVPADRAWLIYPGNPSASRRVRIQAMGDLTRVVSRGVFYPHGRRDAIVVSDRRQSSSGTLTLYTDDRQDRNDVLDLVNLGQVLLLNVDPALGFDIDWQYISIGDVVENRPSAQLTQTHRFITLPYVVTERPAGLEGVAYTWDALANDYDTQSWGQARSQYSSWSALVAHLEWV